MLANPDGPIRILIADEQSLFREALGVSLGDQAHLEVVAEAGDGLHAVSEAERTTPDVVVLNSELPNCDGIRATVLIKERVPECRVLVLSSQEDQRTLVEALEAGASGYMTKDRPLSDLAEATRALHRGEMVIPRRMLASLIDYLMRRRREQDEAIRRLSLLSSREKEVLALLAKGADNDAIAQELVISPQTARTHIQRVLVKLDVHSRLQAAAFIRQSGVSEALVALMSEDASRRRRAGEAKGDDRSQSGRWALVGSTKP